MPLPRSSHGGRLVHGAIMRMVTAGVKQTKEITCLQDLVRARDKPGQDMYHAVQVVDLSIDHSIQTFLISRLTGYPLVQFKISNSPL